MGGAKFAFENKQKARKNCQGVVSEAMKEELARKGLRAAPIYFYCPGSLVNSFSREKQNWARVQGTE